VLGLVVALWVTLGRSVASLAGDRQVPGLRAPVEILFDQYAVPHIYARDADDAYLALGYLHGRERLWQMELYRRASGGRLSEILGPTTLRHDKRFVGLGLRRAAGDEWQTAGPIVRSALDRYSAGVNAAVAQMGRWQRPPEFLALGIEPEPWTPVDSLSVARLMSWRLAENRWGELVRGRLTTAIGASDANFLMGGLPADAPAILDVLGGAAPVLVAPAGSAAPAAPAPSLVARAGSPPSVPGLAWLDVATRAGGSNSWVVGPAKSATGRPLLANDPHLAVELPSIWYEAHLVAGGLDVSGVTLPSSPFVIIGHNQRLAWGLTNAGIDVQDFYVEDVDMTTKKYLYRGEWLPLKSTVVELGVRGGRPDRYEYFSTRHGPLLYTEVEWEIPPDLASMKGRVTPRPLALRWETRGETAGGFDAINRAGNWAEFLAGVRRFSAPSQNFVYADVDGNIGYATSGRLPVRRGGDGGTPSRGSTGEQDWVAVTPPDRLPAMLNPPAAYVVTANAEIDRRTPMTRDWTAPFRTMRLVQRLSGTPRLDVPAMTAAQLDVRSAASEQILRAVDAALKSPRLAGAESDAKVGLDRLRLWDRQVDGRPVVTLYQAFVRALWTRTFEDNLGEDVATALFEYGASERYVGLYAILGDPNAKWWDDLATIDRRETRDDIVMLAAADAVIRLRTKFGSEADWAWDRLHSVHFRHALGAGGLLLDWFFSRGPVPQPGDSFTVRKASINDRAPYAVTDLASYRQVFDVGNWDRSLVVNTTGQSGHPRSPHYFDQNALWASGQYRTMPYTRAAVEKARTSRLLLTPHQ
jgi:penicillin amidase